MLNLPFGTGLWSAWNNPGTGNLFSTTILNVDCPVFECYVLTFTRVGLYMQVKFKKATTTSDSWTLKISSHIISHNFFMLSFHFLSFFFFFFANKNIIMFSKNKGDLMKCFKGPKNITLCEVQNSFWNPLVLLGTV